MEFIIVGLAVTGVLVWGRIPLIAAIFLGLVLQVSLLIFFWWVYAVLPFSEFLYHFVPIAVAMILALDNRKRSNSEVSE